MEDAYRVAELLFPHLPLDNGPTVEQQHVLSPFGEIIANQDFPQQQLATSQKKDALFTVD